MTELHYALLCAWTHILAKSNGLKLKCINDGFVSYKQTHFISQDGN